MLPAVAAWGWCKLTSWPQMTFDLGIRPLTAWTYEGSHIISINQVWFKSDFNFSNEATLTFSACLTTWPQMTVDLGIWPLTAWTYEGSHIISINQVWFQSDFNFWPLSHFQPISQLIYDLWPHQQMRVPMLHLWPGWIHQSMWKLESNVNLFLQQQTTSTTTTVVDKVIPMCLSC